MKYALLAAMAAALPALAQPNAPIVSDNQTFGDWNVRCFAGQVPPCEMTQSSHDKAGKAVTATAFIYLPRRDSYAIALTVPLGVSFAKGVKLTASGYTAQAMPILRCDGQGCHVQGAIERGAIEALERSDADAKLTVGALNGRDAALPLSLKGFAQARAAMEKLAREKAPAAE